MRERLIAVMVGLTLAVIIGYGVPRSYVLADLVRSHESEELNATTSHVALLLRERESSGGRVDEILLGSALEDGEWAEYVTPEGRTVRAGAATGDGEALVDTRELGNGGTLTVSRSGSLVEDRVSDAIQPLIAIGLGLALASAVVGYVLARQVSRPFRELAHAAAALGRGRFDLDVPRYSVPEAEQIGLALRTTAGELGELVRREREFAVNASHQLRTPITALRLELEDLTMWPETPPAVSDELTRALGELDRLSGAIDDLLELARGRQDAAMADVDLAVLVEESARRWRANAERAGRTIVVDGPGTMPARVAPGPVNQILDVLVDNALVHGTGTVTLALSDDRTHLTIKVADEGRAELREEVFRRGVSTRSDAGAGHGIGLAVASELATVYGGRLSLATDGGGTVFVLQLPQRRATDRPVLKG